MRKTVQSLLTAALIVILSLCCGCGTGESSIPVSSEGDIEQITLNFPLITSGESLENLEAVERELNDYLEDKLEARIHLVKADMATLENFYLLQSSRQDPVDFICLLPAESELSIMADSGLMVPLDDYLEEYGTGAASASSDILEIGRLRGRQYMIPQVKNNYTMGTSLEFNASLVKKYQLDVTSIQSIEDVEPFLQMIKENEPDVIPIISPRSNGYISLLGVYDDLIDSFGVLNLEKSQSLTVENWIQSEEFMNHAKLIHDWYKKGYIAKDVLTIQESGASLLMSGQAFCNLSTIMPTADEGLDPDSENGIMEIQLKNIPQLLTSTQAGLEGIGISRFCKEPEHAMKFIDLLFTDPYVANLLEYGIQGKDYTITEDGFADSGGNYFLFYGQPLNQSLCYVKKQYGMNYEEKCRDFREGDVISPAFGFVFDPAPVHKEMALCKAVWEKYYPVINCGCVDPENEIPRFVQELKEAGIDRIIEEKQLQLDAWR